MRRQIIVIWGIFGVLGLLLLAGLMGGCSAQVLVQPDWDNQISPLAAKARRGDFAAGRHEVFGKALMVLAEDADLDQVDYKACTARTTRWRWLGDLYATEAVVTGDGAASHVEWSVYIWPRGSDRAELFTKDWINRGELAKKYNWKLYMELYK